MALHNPYALNILHGTRDLLVGMIPMSIDFPKINDAANPQILSYNLSGIIIEAYEGMKPVSLAEVPAILVVKREGSAPQQSAGSDF